MPIPELDVSQPDIQVTRDPDDPTGWFCYMTMKVDMSPYEGHNAATLRGQGFIIEDTVPDCAVLKRNEEGRLHWSWVNTKITWKVEF